MNAQRHAVRRTGLVVLAEQVRAWRYDEPDIVEAGVRERAEDVVEERPPADRDEGLQPGVGGLPLRVVQGRLWSSVCIRRPRPPARTSGPSRPHHMRTMSSGGVVFQRPRVKSGTSNGALRLPSDCTLSSTTALSAAAS